MPVTMVDWMCESVAADARSLHLSAAMLATTLGVCESCAQHMLDGSLDLASESCESNSDWTQDEMSMYRVCRRFVGIARNLYYLLGNHDKAIVWLLENGHLHLLTQANSSFRPLYDVARAEYEMRKALGFIGDDI